MHTILLILTLFTVTSVFSQISGSQHPQQTADDTAIINSEPFFFFSSGNLSIGTVYGIHPNQRNQYPNGYFYMEGDAAVSIKGIPFKLAFRGSEEPYRSGKPSYFRLAFDAPSYRRGQLDRLRIEIKKTDQAIAYCSDSIHLLEAKWSYWNQKKQEWKLKPPTTPTLPDVPLPNLPDTSGLTLPPLFIPEMTVPSPENPDLPSTTLQSIDLQLSSLEGSLKEQQSKLSELKARQTELQSDYQQINGLKEHGFTDGIRKLDIGLSTLTPGSLSHNAVPMQGIHVSGTINRTFYDVASGFTLPNQLFSNQAFDQMINNTGNVFNAGDLFAVNSVRFVSSAVIGYGERDKNAVSVESFYTGRSWQDIRNQQSGLQQMATNIAFCLTPKQHNNLTWTGSVGHSFSNDSTTIVSDTRSTHLAYSSGITYHLFRMKGEFKAFYRNLGSQYDGWSQGIFLRGAEHLDLSYKQVFTKAFSTTIRGAQDKYIANDSTQAVRKTRRGSLELQWKITHHTAFVSSYTLLELLNDTLPDSKRLSHLGRIGLYDHRTFGKFHYSNTFDGGYAHIAGPDSNQQLLQLSAFSGVEWKRWEFGLKGTYNRYNGLTRLYGESWCIQPEFSYKGPRFMAKLQYQHLRSEQFGTNGGFVFQTQFEISELFTISYFVQRWLPTDYTFFMIAAPGIVKPVYMRWKLTLHLK
jgi:hypothetical protein